MSSKDVNQELLSWRQVNQEVLSWRQIYNGEIWMCQVDLCFKSYVCRFILKYFFLKFTLNSAIEFENGEEILKINVLNIDASILFKDLLARQ